MRLRQIIARRKGPRLEIINADINTALEFINSSSSPAGPDR